MSVASDDFVRAIIGAATGSTVYTYEEFQKTKKEKEHLKPLPIDLDNLHKIVLVRGPVDFAEIENKIRGKKKIEVWVRTLTGKTLTIQCSPMLTVGEFKSLISASEGIPVVQQRIIFAGRQFEDHLTLDYYKIRNKTTVHLVLRLRGGAECMVYLDDTLRSPKYDYDFTKIKDDEINFKRGGYVYKRPVGCYRIALNVLGRYEADNWLGVVGRSSAVSEVPDEWAVSYHGTGKHNLESIAEHGYLLSKGKRFAFGHGIYTTPNIEVAMLYAETFTHGNKKYKYVMQNRVNPNTLIRVSDSDTGSGEYWISEKEEDVRPYGICVKKC